MKRMDKEHVCVGVDDNEYGDVRREKRLVEARTRSPLAVFPIAVENQFW